MISPPENGMVELQRLTGLATKIDVGHGLDGHDEQGLDVERPKRWAIGE
jgi:hypothetical protein